jgi:hypothetical protein
VKKSTHCIFFGGLQALRYNPCPDAARAQEGMGFSLQSLADALYSTHPII